MVPAAATSSQSNDVSQENAQSSAKFKVSSGARRHSRVPRVDPRHFGAMQSVLPDELTSSYHSDLMSSLGMQQSSVGDGSFSRRASGDERSMSMPGELTSPVKLITRSSRRSGASTVSTSTRTRASSRRCTGSQCPSRARRPRRASRRRSRSCARSRSISLS